MTEKCEDCKYYAELRHNFETGKGFEESHACIALANEKYILEIEANGLCEMFSRKEEDLPGIGREVGNYEHTETTSNPTNTPKSEKWSNRNEDIGADSI